jgi:hypothetical protein
VILHLWRILGDLGWSKGDKCVLSSEMLGNFDADHAESIFPEQVVSSWL